MATKTPPTGFADIALSKPISIDGATVNALRMREPTLKDQLTNDKRQGSDVEKELALVADLCMVKPEDLHQLTMRDYRKVQEALLGFLA